MSEHFDPSRRRFIGAAGMVGFSMLGGAARGEEVPLAPPDKQPPDLKVPEPPERTVGWAIVGLGQLALGEVMPAFGQCRLSRPTALVSGHRDKAEKVARAYGVDPKNIYNYDNYDKLRDNADVQAIYIILPNSMHAEFTIRGVKAGKHVLCEKPMAANVAESEQMIASAREAQRKLMSCARSRSSGLSNSLKVAMGRTWRRRTFASAASLPEGRWATSVSTASMRPGILRARIRRK
jgi:hypothetical protein